MITKLVYTLGVFMDTTTSYLFLKTPMELSIKSTEINGVYTNNSNFSLTFTITLRIFSLLLILLSYS